MNQANLCIAIRSKKSFYDLKKCLNFTQKKYLIESKKLFVWNTFFDVKKCFVWMKQNLFDLNKISLDQVNICSNQINFCLKLNKLYLWPYINALISLFWRKINLIQTNIYLVQRYLFWFLKLKLNFFLSVHPEKVFFDIKKNSFETTKVVHCYIRSKKIFFYLKKFLNFFFLNKISYFLSFLRCCIWIK